MIEHAPALRVVCLQADHRGRVDHVPRKRSVRGALLKRNKHVIMWGRSCDNVGHSDNVDRSVNVVSIMGRANAALGVHS